MKAAIIACIILTITMIALPASAAQFAEVVFWEGGQAQAPMLVEIDETGNGYHVEIDEVGNGRRVRDFRILLTDRDVRWADAESVPETHVPGLLVQPVTRVEDIGYAAVDSVGDYVGSSKMGKLFTIRLVN